MSNLTRPMAIRFAVETLGKDALVEHIIAVAEWVFAEDDDAPATEPTPAGASSERPQKGDIVTAEPPQGSIVKRKPAAFYPWTRDADGWYLSSSGESRYSWDRVVSSVSSEPLYLVRWGYGS